MVCGSNILYDNLVFKVVKVNRLKRNKTYIFSSKNSETEKYLTKDYEFVNQRIYADDTINSIKKKIMIYIGTPEINQELWVRTKEDKSPRILGIQYSNIKIDPSLFGEPKPDNRFVAKNGHIISNVIINNNDLTLFDATNNLDIDGYNIYLHDLGDEYDYFREKKIEVNDLIRHGYLNKHWPYGDKNTSKQSPNVMKDRIVKEDKIINFVHSSEIDGKLFGDCSIIQLLFHITNDYIGEFIDLRKIFQFFVLDENTPFMRYKDCEWPVPYFIFYRPLIEKGLLTEKQMKEWTASVKINKDTKLKEIKYSTRGLTLKYFLYSSEGENKYGTISIHRNGNVEIRFSFKENNKTSIEDVYNALLNIKSLIKKINCIDYRINRKIPRSTKITEPEFIFDKKNNTILFGKNIHLILIDAINDFNITKNSEIDYPKLNKFAEYFWPFVSPYIQSKSKNKTNITKTSLILKYKRISNYSRMNEVFEFIQKTVIENPNLKREEIILLVKENFGKDLEEALEIYQEWNKKYGFTRGMRQSGIEIRMSNGKIHIRGSKSIQQLTNIMNFVGKFLSIYFHIDKYSKKSSAKDIFVNSKNFINETEVENETYLQNINSNSNVNYLNIEDIENTLGTTEYEDFTGDLIGNVISVNENENVNVNVKRNEDSEFLLNRSRLEKNDGIGKDIRLKCKDKDIESDTCKDFCEDSSYVLRRLQRHDKSIFGFSADPKYMPYARKCQSQDRQPIVLQYDPSKNPKIKRGSYTYSIKYGSSPDKQYYYICPQAWCSKENMPILMSDIDKKEIIERVIKGKKCKTAKCPSCLKKGEITWLRIIPDDKYNPYPGFIDPSQHPNGLCMPCCFTKPMNTPKSSKYHIYKKCSGIETKNEDMKTGSIDYIMGREKMPLSYNRYGLLPTILSKIFTSPLITKCETGYMNHGATCFLRCGTKDDDEQSFLQCIASITSASRDVPTTKAILKDYLFNKKLTERLFDSLKQGELKTIFGTYDNYKKYMLSNKEFINEEYLWDLLSRPGILFPNGTNIYIFTSNSLLCPVGENVKNFYSSDKQTIFIYKNGRYYEPIYRVTNNNGNIIDKKDFTSLDPEAMKIYNIAIENCVSKNIVCWDKIRKQTLPANQYYEIKDNITLPILIKKLESDISIVGQIKDGYNKSVALVTGNNYILPFVPQGEDLNIPVISKWRPQKLLDTIKFYKNIVKKYGLPYMPIKVFKRDEKSIAILLENNIIIPVSPSSKSSGLIESHFNYYPDADDMIVEGKEEPDKRLENVLYNTFINESYERLRFELGRILQTSSVVNEKKQIMEIINENTNMSIKNRREKLRKIICKIVVPIVTIRETLPFDINKYVRPNDRRQCGLISQAKCNESFHCYYTGDKCKLLILKTHPITKVDNYSIFIDKIIEEILRNKFLRDEILEDKVDDIIDKKMLSARPNEIMFEGTTTAEIFKSIKKLFEKKKDIQINTADMFSTVRPKYYGIDKEKFLVSNKELEVDKLNIQPITGQWMDTFRSVDNWSVYEEKMGNNTLFYSIIRMFDRTDNRIKSVRAAKQLLIDKINNIDKENINNVNMYKNIDKNDIDQSNRILMIYKQFGGTLYKSINSVSALGSFILNNDYPANHIDVFLLSLALNVNIVLLEKRKNKENRKGMYLFIHDINKDTVILFTKNQFDKKIFSPISKNNRYILNINKDLPKEFVKKYISNIK